ncbi:MAG: pyridoxal-phosphate dependent enzyme, partial [Acidimicrobiales bacterium]
MADQGRVDLAARDTPLQPADRLGAALGFAPGALWVKRDDLTGLAGGGNKARKLEVLVAAALAERADTLVTGGAGQSNHVRMTAAAAARFGLACSAVLLGSPPAAAEGNLVLDALLGAELSWAAWDTAAGALDAACARAVAAGRRPYLIPLGGSSPLGASGYAACADELIAAAPPD